MIDLVVNSILSLVFIEENPDKHYKFLKLKKVVTF